MQASNMNIMLSRLDNKLMKQHPNKYQVYPKTSWNKTTQTIIQVAHKENKYQTPK